MQKNSTLPCKAFNSYTIPQRNGVIYQYLNEKGRGIFFFHIFLTDFIKGLVTQDFCVIFRTYRNPVSRIIWSYQTLHNFMAFQNASPALGSRAMVHPKVSTCVRNLGWGITAQDAGIPHWITWGDFQLCSICTSSWNRLSPDEISATRNRLPSLNMMNRNLIFTMNTCFSKYFFMIKPLSSTTMNVWLTVVNTCTYLRLYFVPKFKCYCIANEIQCMVMI